MRYCTWLKRTAALAAVTLIADVALVAVPSAGAAEPAPVRIGLVKSLFRGVPELLIPIGLRPMKELMESQTGIPGELIPSGDADKLAGQITNDDMQFGVFHGVEFAYARQNNPNLTPLVVAVNQHPYIRALVVVRSDGKAAALADLKGQVVSVPRMRCEHCHLYLERHCCPAGQAPQTYFGQVKTPFDAEDAMDDVVDDGAQAAVVDEVAYEAYQKNKPGRAEKLKVLQQSEVFPCAVIAFDPDHVSAKTVAVFRAGLLAAKDNPKAQALLKANCITGFELVPDDYEQQLSDILEAYPPPTPTPK
jgi:ABC-type phosphate/phosphonate transport system substrate-binding protein